MQQKSDVPQNRAFAIRCYLWSRAIHWVTVALVGGLLATALFQDIDPRGAGNRAFLWHSTLGVTVYVLSIARVLLWFVYRPTAYSLGKAGAGIHQGLRVAFYAVLIALPISGWWLAFEEGMPAHAFGIPALPQWYHREAASHPGPGGDAAQEDSVRHLQQLHASLGALLAVVVVLHLLSAASSRKQHPVGQGP